MISLIAVFVLASAAAAFAKNRNVAGWALAAVLLPVISFVVLCGLPDEPVESKEGS